MHITNRNLYAGDFITMYRDFINARNLSTHCIFGLGDIYFINILLSVIIHSAESSVPVICAPLREFDYVTINHNYPLKFSKTFQNILKRLQSLISFVFNKIQL